jgi:microcystin-dependent protein
LRARKKVIVFKYVSLKKKLSFSSIYTEQMTSNTLQALNALNDKITARFLFNMVQRNNMLDDLRDAVVGDFKWSARNADFSGWLVCDGRAVSRNIYSDLFSVIGTSFGAGDGTTTFNLPDVRGRVTGAIGQGSGLTNRALGARVGAETHTLTASEMPSHNHSINDPGHTHTLGDIPIGNQGTDNAFNSTQAADNDRYTGTTSNSATGISINSTGGGQAHNNMQPTIFLGNVFIYTAVAEFDRPTYKPIPIDNPEDQHSF